MTVTYLWPYPPSVNRIYRRKNGVGMFKAARWEQWKNEVYRFMQDQPKPPYYEGNVRVEYIVSRPDKRKRDVTNLIKPLDDMLQYLGVVADDCQIVDCRIAWDTEDRVANGLMVTVEAA